MVRNDCEVPIVKELWKLGQSLDQGTGFQLGGPVSGLGVGQVARKEQHRTLNSIQTNLM